mmetsp:Transcript_41773/g.88515  ORF Transcript_41773/g.88515 Transcript_41773/m.88515 type:complete len:682 (+) Transcript_41773:95-2140(+)
MRGLVVSVVFAPVWGQSVPRPVAKVVKLLQDMSSQLDSEGAEDKEAYEKIACWCKKNDEAKTDAIAEAKRRISSLRSSIEGGTGLVAQLKTQIAGLEDEIKGNQDALKEATSMRDKAHAEFIEEEKDMTGSIASLKSAVTVLSKHNGGSLVAVQNLLREAISKHTEGFLAELIGQEGQKVAKAFVQASQPDVFSSYSSQSGQVFGMLKEMKEQFEKNLASSQKDETKDQEDYAALKGAKDAEMKAANEQVTQKTNELADAQQQLANDKGDLEDTEEALESDSDFLYDLKQKCKQTDVDYRDRSKKRHEEQLALADALSMLNSDESFDLFGKTLSGSSSDSSESTEAPTFLQLRRHKHKAVSKSRMTTKRRASDLLRKVASETNDTGLSALAVMVQLDAFTKVKQAISDMITQLNKEQEEEQKHKDFCVAELDQNQRQATNSDNDKTNYQSELDQLNSKIKTATKEIDDATTEINDLNIEMGRATDDRNEANNEFQQTVADQRATQTILKKVADRLGQVYESFAQTSTAVDSKSTAEPGAETPPAPPAMKDYAQQDGGKVVAMLETIIQDARELEAKTVQAEKDEQAAYEKYIRDSNDEIGAKQRFVTDKSEERATYKAEKAQTEANLKEALNSIDKLAAYRTQLHKDCDDTLDNFDMRQDARQSEIDALGQAKNILAGSTE